MKLKSKTPNETHIRPHVYRMGAPNVHPPHPIPVRPPRHLEPPHPITVTFWAQISPFSWDGPQSLPVGRPNYRVTTEFL